MFSTPLICSSSGVATVSATVTGLAPGNCAVTWTDGGTTSGYSEIGRRVMAIRPARKMATEMTPAKIGRSMKKRDNIVVLLGRVLSRAPADRRGRLRLIACGVVVGLRHDSCAGRKALQVI